MKRAPRPVVITNAERSQGDQLHSREVRYLLMMSFRALCLVAAAVLVGTHAPLLWLWIPICLIGMVLIPWLAVLLANDRPPRSRAERAERAAASAGDEPAALPAATEIRIIDADEVQDADTIWDPNGRANPDPATNADGAPDPESAREGNKVREPDETPDPDRVWHLDLGADAVRNVNEVQRD